MTVGPVHGANESVGIDFGEVRPDRIPHDNPAISSKYSQHAFAVAVPSRIMQGTHMSGPIADQMVAIIIGISACGWLAAGIRPASTALFRWIGSCTAAEVVQVRDLQTTVVCRCGPVDAHLLDYRPRRLDRYRLALTASRRRSLGSRRNGSGGIAQPTDSLRTRPRQAARVEMRTEPVAICRSWGELPRPVSAPYSR